MNKKLISTIFCIILVMVQIPANLFAEAAALKINDVAYDSIYYPEAKYAEFSLACDHDAMLYGDPIRNYEDKTYQFFEKKLYVESNG
ncbi:MAG: hypothetical protein J1E60_04450 [Christensenellaceae bacterium]|nr:hypothetical protein [Christensenellaceae bacterium]